MAMVSYAWSKPQYPLYQYTQLNAGEIRVIWLEPATTLEAPVHCRMKTIDLARRSIWNQYRTLSYAWGPTYPNGSHLTDYILCGGRRIPMTATPLPGRRIPVTATLLQALRRFRAEFSNPERDVENSNILIQPLTKWLWIDAISINQLDMSERSQQVSRMADIYRQSMQLEIWLGVGARTRNVIRNGTLDDAENSANLMEELRQRPWFGRRWVLQEYRLSRNARWFRLGEHTFQLPHGVSLRLSPASSAAPMMGGEPSPYPLLCELYYSRILQCSQPRDFIYALLHISADTGGIPIDYAIPVEELYLAVAARMAKHSVLMLQALSSCATVFGSTAVPSWVPDWRTGCDEKLPVREHKSTIAMLCHEIVELERSGRLPVEMSVEVNGQTLLIQGSVLQPCFPPMHAKSEECDTCRVFTYPWNNFWSKELKCALESMAAKKQVLFMIKDHEDGSVAYALTPAERVTLSQRWPAYQLGEICFKPEQICFTPEDRGFREKFKSSQLQLPTLSTIQPV
ncbi:hypothetical protein LTR27_011104 [Elasticomyces elasticus]|nr:hypothetical protein LTR27_011104 [Elasticomyces elasticus]